MTFKLKKGQETFQVVDGPDAGRTYERGQEYETLPKGEEHRFEKVSVPTAALVKSKELKTTKEKK
ncbi:hypothetical protein [Desulfobacula phenolica]|uniref:Uncharacterized protein n=1 Tax=Desulfobacula phenolica TaxID=90732 RepID=A0A1H2H4G8_9BACT|nr:hypothetical protein [Desulfobacula phenolica]SDU26693.1 hypothetical protein SAMN04487931_10640 [Desulfobacula phenolica]